MNVSFHPAARDEFIAAAEYYDRAVPGLGDRFLVAVRRTIAFAVERPEAGNIRTANTRRLFVHGFPYDLVYQVRGQELQVVAVAHQHRRPGYWRNRLSG